MTASVFEAELQKNGTEAVNQLLMASLIKSKLKPLASQMGVSRWWLAGAPQSSNIPKQQLAFDASPAQKEASKAPAASPKPAAYAQVPTTIVIYASGAVMQ